VLPIDKHLSNPIQQTDLNIWLKFNLAADGLHSGETLCRDLVKLTPLSRLRLLDGTTKAHKPETVFKSLSQQLDQPEWVKRHESNGHRPPAGWTPLTLLEQTSH